MSEGGSAVTFTIDRGAPFTGSSGNTASVTVTTGADGRGPTPSLAAEYEAAVTVTATTPGVTAPATFTETAKYPAETPAYVGASYGNGQSAVARTQLQYPLVAYVVGNRSGILKGVPVTFTLTSAP